MKDLRLSLGSGFGIPGVDNQVYPTLSEESHSEGSCSVIAPLLLQIKTCTKCKTPKSLDAFGKDPKRSLGRASWCKQCNRIYLSPRYRHRKSQRSRENRAKLRLEILTHYSPHHVPECTCCGEQTIQFLVIDHVNGGGGQHRKKIHNTYTWIKKNNFPTGFQTLCYNCNVARGLYGYCPHQPKR